MFSGGDILLLSQVKAEKIINGFCCLCKRFDMTTVHTKTVHGLEFFIAIAAHVALGSIWYPS